MTSDNELVSTVIEKLPSHHEKSASPEALAQQVADATNAPLDRCRAVVDACIVFLKAMGILLIDEDGGLRIKSQMPDYFRHSLTWYVRNDREFLSNWDRSGTSEYVNSNDILDSAPYFLKAMEKRRISLGERDDIVVEPSRIQEVSVILFCGKRGDDVFLLHQWDQKSRQYQLIGGKNRPREKESAAETAKREVAEELKIAKLVYGRDYELEPLTTLEETEVSRTYGAFTKYQIHVYWAIVKAEEFAIDVNQDAWLSLREVKQGEADNGNSIASLGQKLLDKYDLLEGGGLRPIDLEGKSDRENPPKDDGADGAGNGKRKISTQVKVALITAAAAIGAAFIGLFKSS